MNLILPNTLYEAERLIQNSLISCLKDNNHKLLSINLVFENIRLNPLIKRLHESLKHSDINSTLLWADSGGAALAKRDMPDKAEFIFSYSEFISLEYSDKERPVIAVSPQPYDYEEFENICNGLEAKVIMFNGKLEDMAVGVGSLGRERRKEFIYSWKQVFWLQPLSMGALKKEYNQDWTLFSLDEDGYRFCTSFKNKPDEETILNELKA
tara:strand:+ start:52 stop:681 length:630 start_codon:yes stop_codon:yes gene_type:complete